MVGTAPADASAEGAASRHEPRSELSRRPAVARTWWAPAAAVTVYAVLALAANWPTWPGDPSRIRPGDLEQMAWFLAWTPYALVHHQDPLFTTWLNYPNGVNLAQNTSVPLLGLLTAPLTFLVNPIASLNLLQWLAFPISASSMFFVLRRWVSWDVGAFAGGAVYGFSPYLVAQGFAHLDLVFVPLPPLIFLAGYETLRPDRPKRWRWGVALGVLVVAQFFISPEIAATTMLVAAFAAVALALARPSQVVRCLAQAVPALALAAVIVIACLAFPVWGMVAGPHGYRGPAYPGGLGADLLGAVTPTSWQHFAPAALRATGSKLLDGNMSENGSYLGLPLLLLIGVLVVTCWRRPWIRLCAVMLVVTTVLSFGAHLTVDNHQTSIALPWDLLSHLPFADDVLAVRLALYSSLFAGALVALGADELHARWAAPQRSGHRRRRSQRRPSVAVLVVAGALGVLAVLSLVPQWPLPTQPAGVPAYFSSSAVARVPAGSVTLVSPYPSVANPAGQLWQAVAGMRFRIIGGYALFADRQGDSTNFAEELPPLDVQRYLWVASGEGPYPPGPVPPLDPALSCQMVQFLRRYHVQSVISAIPRRWPAARNLFSMALGGPSAVGGGVEVWYRVPHRLALDRCTP